MISNQYLYDTLFDILYNNRGYVLNDDEIDNIIKELLTINLDNINFETLNAIHNLSSKNDNNFKQGIKERINWWKYDGFNKMIFSKPQQTINSLNKVFDLFNKSKKEIFDIICLEHSLLTIHPFNNGNRRSISLLFALLLFKYNLVPYYFDKVLIKYWYIEYDLLNNKPNRYWYIVFKKLKDYKDYQDYYLKHI